VTLRVGVFGVGFLGARHARTLASMPEAKLAGFVDPDDEQAARIAGELGLRRFTTLAALAGEIDCAVVATPTTAHHDVAAELIEAGCDVLVEKPITASADDARRLIDLAAARGRVLQVGHSERYNPAITAVEPLLREVRYVEAERIGIFSGRATDVDVLLDLMIHDLNLVQSLLRREVTDIRAVGIAVRTDKVDIANVRLELENGAVANLTASRVSEERVRKVRFFSSDAYYSVDTAALKVKGYRVGKRGPEPVNVEVEEKPPLQAELEAFFACVRDRSKPLVSGEDGLRAVELAQRVGTKIKESLESYRP
jgi:predicted dehydrogenase